MIPTRSCRKRTGPPSECRIEAVTITITGENRAISRIDPAGSNARLNQRADLWAVGGLDVHQRHTGDRPDVQAFGAMSVSAGARIEEWWAGIKAASTARAALRILRAPLVNVEHLTMVWGRRPTRGEVVREFFARPLRGVREEWRVRHARSGCAR